MTTRTRLVAAAASALFFVPVASADPFALYGSHTVGSVSTWGLVRFDTNPLDGSTTRVGRGGLMFDFDFDPSGVLYSPRGSDLCIVNTTTGAQTLVGSFGISSIITSIAFDSDGVLYGTDNDGLNTSLYTINRATGHATRVGAVGQYVFGLDFGPDDTLYGASGEVFTIDTSTGAKKDVVIPFTGSFITGLDYGADNVFRGLESFYQNNFTALREIDLETNSLRLVGQTTEADMYGLASIPAPGVLVVGVYVVSGMARGRRRHTGR